MGCMNARAEHTVAVVITPVCCDFARSNRAISIASATANLSHPTLLYADLSAEQSNFATISRICATAKLT